MKNVKIKFEKPNNPVVGCNKQVCDFITINDEKYHYNEIYEVTEEFFDEYSNVFKEINQTSEEPSEE